jgi:hypothetical protein|tara:strand:+ start:104 stop:337 length:234 start_codon:yes stop_codon:yes gene_type:complete
MSKISKEGYNQIQVIKNALNSMYDKLSNANLYSKDESRKVRDIEKLYTQSDVFESVKEEFEAIAGIVEESGTWAEVE